MTRGDEWNELGIELFGCLCVLVTFHFLRSRDDCLDAAAACNVGWRQGVENLDIHKDLSAWDNALLRHTGG